MKSTAQSIRIRYLYRRKILNGEVTVSRPTASRLIGPDCAYHLYGRHSLSSEGKSGRWNRRGKGK